MYKIYINDTPLFLMEKANALKKTNDDRNLVAAYRGKKKMLLNYANTLESSTHYDSMTLYHEDVEKLWEDFQAHYKLIEAAGGVVYNPKGEALLIFRRGSWDLPKGKIDAGESKAEAAVREVQEETGIQQIDLGAAIHTSWHTYKNRKGKRVLKPTYWYRMTTKEEKLIPQTEEDIEKAVWEDLSNFLATSPIIYQSIQEILDKQIKSNA